MLKLGSKSPVSCLLLMQKILQKEILAKNERRDRERKCVFKNKPKALLAISIIIKTSNNPELLQINLLKGKKLMECKSSLTF